MVDGRNRFALGIEVGREESVGIEHVVSIDLESVPVQLVGARSHVVSEGALAEAILRCERCPLYPKLVHHFKGRIHVGLLAFKIRHGNRNAIEQDLVLEVRSAVDFPGECASLHARREKDELINLPG